MNSFNSGPQPRKAPAAQCVRIHPLVISKVAPSTSSSATVVEFTLADPAEGERSHEERDVVVRTRTWLGRLPRFLPMHASDSDAQLRVDSLFPIPPMITPFVRKPVKIIVRCAPLRTLLRLDVMDIFDDTDAWSVFVPSNSSNSTSSTNIVTELFPLLLQKAPMSMYSAYDPVEFIRDYVT